MAKNRKRKPEPADAIPDALAVDDSTPPETADEQAESFRDHTAEQGRAVAVSAPWKEPQAVEPAAVVAVEIPLAPPDAGYCSRHIEVRLTGRQAIVARRVRRHLDAVGARCAGSSGRAPRPVHSLADVVRWVLDRLADGAPEEG